MPADHALTPFAQLVRKDGVALGGLPRAQLLRALALVWSMLPPGCVMNESQVNQRLLAVLAAGWLNTDHAELRRWLVDAGWLQRDGFCREYRRLWQPQLTPELQAAAAPLAGIADTAAWVAAQRQAQQAERQARHQRWLQQQRA